MGFWNRFKKRVTCMICGRKLHTKKSQKLGMGEVCARKNAGVTHARQAELAGQLRLPLEDQHSDSATE